MSVTQKSLENAQHYGLIADDIGDFLKVEFPPREPLLGEWLTRQTLGMVHAWRGTGKTFFCLEVALAVAGGGEFLGWHAPKPRRVVYLDGEMPGIAMQERLAQFIASRHIEIPNDNFVIVNPDRQEGPMPDLATIEGQEALSATVAGRDLVIVDNISCLVRRGGRENDAESWLAAADWAMAQRRAGRAVLFVHHDGKGGTQRGTSKKEDILDVVINLHRPSDYQQSDGARFVVSFEKARHLTGDGITDFEATLNKDANGRVSWATKGCEDVELQRVVSMIKEGASQREISEELDLSRFSVKRRIDAAIAKGLIKRSEIKTARTRDPK